MVLCDDVQLNGVVPDAFLVTTPEGAKFYFEVIDIAPSGNIHCREVPAQKALREWQAEL
jgi:hypothetical protein